MEILSSWDLRNQSQRGTTRKWRVRGGVAVPKLAQDAQDGKDVLLARASSVPDKLARAIPQPMRKGAVEHIATQSTDLDRFLVDATVPMGRGNCETSQRPES
ncbi:hypothetical protein E4U30_007866 [Claviceps sp. LM220 group G6]|nr:hypothetical protein E4U30_007866 [Claviceps sp. LM220 group G6]KAG6103710.1 hypothetical protein E4U31_002611 [Claviceps sp. LM219 group G6]KAG6105771.1 hypothetical protein E4U14_004943 [Claviceps sp. LM454 group G7]